MIIVEDGSVVLGANSYSDVAYARSYASSRGFTLPLDDDEVEKLLLRGMEYIETRSGVCGSKVDPEQSLLFPRSEIYIDCYEMPSDVIPEALKKAQVHVALALSAGIDPQANLVPELPVVQETVDVLTIKYGYDGNHERLARLTIVDDLLRELFSCGGRSKIRFQRV